MVADIWEDGARQVCEQYGIPKYVKDYKDLIADADVDAVLICSPTDQHASQIIEAFPTSGSSAHSCWKASASS
eukprot:evm.model.NODE_5579_length_11332_cov_19.341246.4